ncbi:hypothetical protein MES4922_300152 [Mesorhizobium ventifaucium]|uniref:Uncharacterized protein n=1 Tax=Mesorhizobium ventifaucium TaxID=666020 RepID=A0ABN8JYA3_9HYPH|nr:hypothetical protein MES4922_300152 [Mesorhizobium ventifaucium]
MMVDFGYSSKLNAEWAFLTMLRDEGRKSANAFLAAYADDLGKTSSHDPRRLMPAAIALGTSTFTMSALPGTPSIQNAIPMPFFGTPAVCGAGPRPSRSMRSARPT